ncbi:hypothetical protein H9Q71_009605 [Fusarium xylarioides]|nr:hypothetical protein H9Q71_009605 [Fusarium xylarioides]
MKPNLWAFKGRNDDIVVLSNGYKISPLETEALVTTHPDIKGCLMVQRDYVAFAAFDKPFIRTDKGTVKRRATLEAYGDFIERFYSSRLETDPEFVAIDTSSIASVTDGVRRILGTLSPAGKEAALDDDLFVIGFDSMLVFRAIKSLRAATKLGELLAPRHLYGSPTLRQFSATLVQLVAEKHRKAANEAASDEAATDGVAEMYRMIDLHRARLSQKGLRFAMAIIPELEGKLIPCSEDEIGYKKGDVRITLPPVPYTSTATQSTESSGPRQLRYQDLSTVLPSFAELQAGGFLCSSFVDDIVLLSPLAPPLPADVFMTQANFIDGGCILAINLHHQCFDGTGAIMVMRLWGDCCRYAQGEASATCDWLDKQSLNRNIPQILHELEGYVKPVGQVDKNVWGFIDIPDPVETENETQVKNPINESTLPPAPLFPRKFEWPPTRPSHGRPMKSSTFVMSAEMVEQLWQDVLADPTAEGVTSVSDIIQAFVWRSAIKARYHVATHLRCEAFDEDEVAIVELPIDVRPYFSKLLPESYMGNLVIINRPSMPVATLCGTGTTVGQVAQVLRAAAVHITPSLVHDAFTLLQSVSDYTKVSTACMGMDGMHIAVNNLMAFPNKRYLLWRRVTG